MMYSAIVIALTIACSNGVMAYTIPTTLPPITGPPTFPPTPYYTSSPPNVCYEDGLAIAVGETYENKHVGNEMCRVYDCENPPSPYSHFACYDSTTDKCVNYGSTQMKDGCERVCESYTSNGGPGWVAQGCDTTLFTTPPPPPTTTPPPPTTTPPPPTPTPSIPPPPPRVCYVDGVAIAVGEIYGNTRADNELCWAYGCFKYGNELPDAYHHLTCYDSTTDKCVSYYSTQMKDGCERVCEPYTSNGGPGWVTQGCDTTLQPGCNINGVHYPYGDIPNSGGCSCDYSGYMLCP